MYDLIYCKYICDPITEKEEDSFNLLITETDH